VGPPINTKLLEKITSKFFLFILLIPNLVMAFCSAPFGGASSKSSNPYLCKRLDENFFRD